MFKRFLRIDPNYFSFLSGIFASAGINLLTGLLSTDTIPRRWPYLTISACLTVISSVAWAVFAWELSSIERLAIVDAPRFVSSEAAWERLVDRRRAILVISLTVAILLAASGIVVLILGY